MKCLVLCGGKGTRLKPLTFTIPKQLVPVANRPILHFVLDNIIKSGLSDIGIIIAPETGGLIQESVEEYKATINQPVKFTFLVQDEPKGLAHAVKTARDFLGEEPFLMYLGDNLIGGDLVEFISRFYETEVDALLLLKAVPDPTRFGIATLNAQGEIVHLEEKPKFPQSNLALVGVYLFSSAIHWGIERIKPSFRGELEITDAISQLIDAKKKVKAYILDKWWLDTGKKDTLLAANRIILQELIERKIEGEVSSQSQILGKVVIAKDAVVENSAVRGPAVIGKGTKIINSSIGPYTAIADECLVEDSKIESSIVLKGTQIKGIDRLADSLIGRNVRIEKNQKFHQCLRLLISDDSEVEV
uniref:Glucose-1-phosphate thymidylyltransferase n=1 Tax=candidate division WOR-3 bacterium TaxID=2052148 RepID=A0A7C3UPY4_UNCW3